VLTTKPLVRNQFPSFRRTLVKLSNHVHRNLFGGLAKGPISRFFRLSFLFSKIPVGFLLAFCGVLPASAALITNGDFEANGGYIDARFGLPAFGLPGLPVPTGWTAENIDPRFNFAAAVIGIDFGADGAGLYTFPAGHVAALYGGGGITQSFATDAGSDYVLTYDTSGRGFGGVPHLTLLSVTLLDGATSLATDSFVETDNFPTDPTAHGLTFQAGSATTRVKFDFIYNDPLYDGRYFALVDNVVVTEVSSAAPAPEPESGATILVGIGLITGVARSRFTDHARFAKYRSPLATLVTTIHEG
jgi:hypothetical protein